MTKAQLTMTMTGNLWKWVLAIDVDLADLLGVDGLLVHSVSINGAHPWRTHGENVHLTWFQWVQ